MNHTIIPTLHPAGPLRSKKPMLDTIMLDLKKALDVESGDAQLEEEHLIPVLPSNEHGLPAAFNAGIAWLRHWLEHRTPIFVDVETSALEYFSCRLYSIAVSGLDGNNVAVGWTLHDYHTIPRDMEDALTSLLAELLRHPDIPKGYHNAPFDQPVLRFKGFTLDGPLIDTIALAHVIQPDIPHTLEWAAQTYLAVRPWKMDNKGNKLAFERDPHRLVEYNCRDALYTALLSGRQLQHINQIYEDPGPVIYAQNRYANLATTMACGGLPIHFPTYEKLARELLLQAFLNLQWIRKYLNWPDFNPNSSNQVREALYGRKYAGAPWNLGLQVTQRTDLTKVPSTSYKAIIDHLEHPFVRAFTSYLDCRTTYGTCFKGYPDEEAARLKTLTDIPNSAEWQGWIEDCSEEEFAALDYLDLSAGIAAAEAGKGKPSSYRKAIHTDGRLYYKPNPTKTKGVRFGTSPNVQNLKYIYRIIFQAPEGRTFVGADKDQLELRIAACLAGQEELLHVMRQPSGGSNDKWDPSKDPHTYALYKIYAREVKSWSQERIGLQRDMLKNVVYASLYGAGIDTVYRTIRERKQMPTSLRAALTKTRVKQIYYGYFGSFPEFEQLRDDLMREVVMTKALAHPPFGRIRRFPFGADSPPNEVNNWKGQGIGAEFVTTEMCDVQDELDRRYKGDAWVNLHLHDQLDIECATKNAQEIADDIVTPIFGATPFDGPKGRVYLTAKPTIANNLRDAK